MPKVITTYIDPEKNNGHNLQYEYDCECGCRMKYVTSIKPKRLPKCFECNIPITPTDEKTSLKREGFLLWK